MSDDFRGAGNVRWDWDYRGVLKPMKVSDVEEKRTYTPPVANSWLRHCGDSSSRQLNHSSYYYYYYYYF